MSVFIWSLPGVVYTYDWSCELYIDLISTFLQVDFIVHGWCWSRELHIVKELCKLVLFMHCSYLSFEYTVVHACHWSCELCIIFIFALLQICFIIFNRCWSHELHIVKYFCKLVFLICCSYSSLEFSVVCTCDQRYELHTIFTSTLLQVDYIVHDHSWNCELNVVKAFYKLVLLMCYSCSSLEHGVVRTCHQSCELHIILIFPFYKLVLLFMIVVGAMNFTLLKFFASKSSSLLFMFVVETHFSSFL